MAYVQTEGGWGGVVGVLCCGVVCAFTRLDRQRPHLVIGGQIFLDKLSTRSLGMMISSFQFLGKIYVVNKDLQKKNNWNRHYSSHDYCMILLTHSQQINNMMPKC